ncbi:non-ribosomal peptide synthetase [Zobellia barbeyronii]|uniref:Amino acid adenylation domain-containing protein n=1 Tax=Zobellia barbeyronii TaxID=2748009 RepID=A0ABS5WLY3_9FLAO|nr:non-ribosomal peptide synthetase [Zobellia barbeyronii]MBT2163177.1 amino acid adenylation domain-containing protein [Zobellia barbeyronii]
MEKSTDKSSLLNRWKNREAKESALLQISKAPVDVQIPLSSGQQRIWFLQQLYTDNPFYNYSEALTFEGNLNVEMLKKSLNHLFLTNEVLRSYYPAITGSPVSKIDDTIPNLVEFDLSHLTEIDAKEEADTIMRKQSSRVFDLSEPGLVRVSLLKYSAHRFVLFFTLHHIVIDEWSIDVLKQQLADSYLKLIASSSLETKPETIQFSDYAHWERTTPIDNKQLDYWKNTLSGNLPILNLQTDSVRPARPSFKGKQKVLPLDKKLSSDILNKSKQLGTTPFVFLLTVYYVLLYRYTGQSDILVGTPIANRSVKSLEKVLGFFINTVVLRSTVLSTNSFSDLIEVVKKNTLSAFSNKEVPFDVLVKELKVERSLAVSPFFQVMFLYHSATETPSFGSDLRLIDEAEFDTEVSKFDLTLSISEFNGLLSLAFEYDTDLFEAATISRFLSHYKILLQGIIVDPNEDIGNLPMMSLEEEKVLLPVSKETKNHFKSYKAIHHIIADVTHQFPQNKALTFNDVSITYQELDEQADAIAHAILQRTKKRNEVVMLCMDRSTEMIVSMLAILKAGCAYLPMDPKYPMERLNFILEDADCNIVVSHSSLASVFDSTSKNVILVDKIETNKTMDVILPEVREDDLAYIIYTSGSTGKPKGVPITHKNIINSTVGRLDFYPENPSAFLLMSSISFDSSKASIYWTLCTGGNLILTENRIEQDITRIEDLVQRHKVSHTLMLPTLYKVILEHGNLTKLESFKTVIVAGEACTRALGNLHFKSLPDTGLYNEYGPTEATVWCIAHKVERTEDSDMVSIGKAVANAEVYLLNESKKLVPYGAVGEIYIGGPSVSNGYINRTDLTEKVFLNNPLKEGSNEKIYKTGDLGRCRNDGTIEFLGRVDHQVKVRGFRIELDEVEKTISEYDSVSAAVAMVEDNKRLVAYVTADEEVETDALKSTLKAKLPGYMVPTRIVQVDKFPVLPNGKVDKVRLAQLKPSAEEKENTKIELPSSELEKKMAAIWKEVLDLPSIGIHENFFDIGGDSILSIQVISKAKAENLVVSPNQLFEHQTISELTRYLEAQNKHNTKAFDKTEFKHLVPIRSSGTKPPLFCLHSGGTHFFYYNQFANHLNPDRPVYALQASDHEDELVLHKSVHEMAIDFITEIKKVQPQGPYHFIAYCYNTAIGMEVTRLLGKTNDRANLIIADTMADYLSLFAPSQTNVRTSALLNRLKADPIKTVHRFVRSKFILPLKEKYKTLTSSGSEKLIRTLHNNHIKLYREYDWKPIANDIQILLTEKSATDFNTKVIASWRKMTNKEVVIVSVEGSHDKLFEDTTIVKKTASSIDACMKEFESTRKTG